MQNYYQIESIFCTGKARGSRSTGGYTFVVKGRAVKDSSNLSMGRRTFELLPLAASSSAVTGMATAYIFPQVPAGEPFEFEFTGLFDGYFDVSDFGGFLLTD
ncbi:MAG: hypothetical protein LUD68_00720 [Rikenellaceae bacterium]|nr:hypothetical protein [Rikenellaceae bacterium]